jgi:hypothetical protein
MTMRPGRSDAWFGSGVGRAARRISGVFALLALALASVGTAVGTAVGEEGPPSADQVIAKAIDALGGGEAMRKLQTRWMEGRMEIPAMGLKASLTSHAQRPDRTHTSMQSEAFGTVEEGGEGETFWEHSAMRGPKLKKGPELTRAKREADFDGLLNWKSWYKSAETQGADTLDGKPAWKVVMVPNDGAPETTWFDQSTGLPVKQAAIIKSDEGDIPAEAFLSDYREVGGVKSPFHIKQSIMKGVQVVEIFTDSLRVNVELPADAFTPPPEVKALIEKEAAEKAAGQSAGQPAEQPAGASPDKPAGQR